MVKVYGFEVWDQAMGEYVRSRYKMTAEALAKIDTARPIPETLEEVPAAALDEERRWDGETRIVQLPAGERAPLDADWLRIDKLPNGRFNVSGCVAFDRGVIVTDGRCESLEDAKLAGLAWAQDRGAKVVYVEWDNA